jgi:hypothetical protein
MAGTMEADGGRAAARAEVRPVPAPGEVRRALAVAGAAAALGVVGDALLRPGPWGVNVTVWAAALVGAALLLRDRFDADGSLAVWAPAALGFAALAAWRDSPTLRLLDLAALGVVFCLGMAHARGAPLRALGIARHLEALLASVGDAVAGAAVLLGREVRWRDVGGGERRRHLAAAARGLALGLPLLVLFGALLASADAAFQRLVDGALRLGIERAASHLVLAAALAWIAAGVLRALVGGEKATPRPAVARRGGVSLGIVEAATVLALLNALFLVFVAAQLPYFFGGDAIVRGADAPSYAAYARRGFFELVTVGALSLGVLLAGDWLVRDAPRPHLRWYRLLAAVQVGLVGVMMASALHRMRLYQLAYGLTELRVYTTAFMLWLGAVFAWFAFTVLRGRRHRFAFGALVAAADVVVILHLVNPDALIVRANAGRPDAAARFDAGYAASLGADAVPALIAVLGRLPDERRCVAVERVLARRDGTGGDWRTWTLGRHRATRAVDRRRAELEGMRCPAGQEAAAATVAVGRLAAVVVHERTGTAAP